MKRVVGFDSVLLAAVLVALLLGLLMVYSASAALAVERTGTPSAFFVKQCLWVAVGLFGLVVCMHLRPTLFKHPLVVAGGIGLTLLLLCAVFFFPTIRGTNRWIRLGPVSFQPLELAKLTYILFCAYALSRLPQRRPAPPEGVPLSGGGLAPSALEGLRPYLWPLLVLLIMISLLLHQPDLGGAVTLFGLGVLCFYWAGAPPLSLLYLLGFAGVGFVVMVLGADYRVDRFLAFLYPDRFPLDLAYQINQSLIAIGSGGFLGASHDGFLGTGLGAGKQKLFFLPDAHTDFIYSVLGEELGLLGTLVVVAAFLVILWRGLRIAHRLEDRFLKLTAFGWTVAIVLPAFLNMSVCTGLLPTTGIAFPFLSYGGSSLVINCCLAGGILNLSRFVR